MSSEQPQESRENGEEKKLVAAYFIVLVVLLGQKNSTECTAVCCKCVY